MNITSVNSFKLNLTNVNFLGKKDIKNNDENTQNLSETILQPGQDKVDFSYNPNKTMDFLISDGLDGGMASIISGDEETFGRYKKILGSMRKHGTKFMHETSTKNGLLVLNLINDNSIGKKTARRIAALEALGVDNALYYAKNPDAYYRAIEMISEDSDGKVTLFNESGKDTVLPRPLTVEEFNALISPTKGKADIFDSEMVKNYVKTIDSGLDAKNAAKIVVKPGAVDRYSELIHKDMFGQTILKGEARDTMLSRSLTPKEAAAVVLDKHKEKLSNGKVQTFIDLKDTNVLNDAEALHIVSSFRDSFKFFSMITPDANGKVTFIDSDGGYNKLPRPFSPKEAIGGLYLKDDYLPAYQKLIDAGVSIGEASVLASDPKRTNIFFFLTSPNTEDGRIKIKAKGDKEYILPRALYANEALIATSERFGAQKIYNQLTEYGHIKSDNSIG